MDAAIAMSLVAILDFNLFNLGILCVMTRLVMGVEHARQAAGGPCQ